MKKIIQIFKRNYFSNPLICLAILLSFFTIFFKAYSFIDPDFGWHLETGKIIITSGFPKTDPFSYTMPSFPFVDHEWLADVLTAVTFPYLGIIGLASISSFLVLTAILISFRKVDIFASLLLMIAVSSFTPFMGISPRIFSWFFFSLLSYLVFNKRAWQKLYFLSPIILFFWANTHGSFPLGLVVLFIAFLVRTLDQRKILFKELLVLIFAFLATLVTPYGLKTWWIVGLTIFDEKIKSNIAEWQPAYMAINSSFFLEIFLLVLLILVISKYWRKLPKDQLILNQILFVGSIMAVRNIPLWIISSLPIVHRGFSLFKRNIKYKKLADERLLKTVRIGFVVLLIILFSKFLMTIYNTHYLGEGSFYPKDAVRYLQNNPPRNEIFSVYDWGGYLIWKLPGRKVSIYGAMPVWKRLTAPVSESVNAMEEYKDITQNNGNCDSYFEKYNIDTLLLPLKHTESILSQVLQKYLPFFYTPPDTTGPSCLYKISTDNHWRTAYEDGNAIIYKHIE